LADTLRFKERKWPEGGTRRRCTHCLRLLANKQMCCHGCNACVQMHIHSLKRARIRAHMHVHMHTRAHTHTHAPGNAHTCTHTRTHIHTLAPALASSMASSTKTIPHVLCHHFLSATYQKPSLFIQPHRDCSKIDCKLYTFITSNCASEEFSDTHTHKHTHYIYIYGWPKSYICAVYDRMYGDFPAKNTVCTRFIPRHVWFWPALNIEWGCTKCHTYGWPLTAHHSMPQRQCANTHTKTKTQTPGVMCRIMQASITCCLRWTQ